MKIKIQEWDVFTLGDHAIVFSLEAKVHHKIVYKITELATYITEKKVGGIIDIIPSYHTLTIVYDLITFIKKDINTSEQINSFCTNLLIEFNKEQKNIIQQQNTTIPVPVCYDKTFGIDIDNLSIVKNISIKEIISIHTSTIYEVYSIGFLPGFTYMGIVDEKIQMPRHEKPRMSVNAGSVGIAGLQTGIYPSNSPGGWQIIGRTPWNIFDRNEKILAKFKVGDLVQFYAIEKEEFDKLNEHK
jgi:inhibitor of KinA